MTCWGLGAEAVGYYFERDRARCDNCGRWAVTPLWYNDQADAFAYAFNLRVLCEKCAILKHTNCPCQARITN